METKKILAYEFESSCKIICCNCVKEEEIEKAKKDNGVRELTEKEFFALFSKRNEDGTLLDNEGLSCSRCGYEFNYLGQYSSE